MKNPPKKAPRGSHKILQDENDQNVTCAVWFDTKPVRFISVETDPRIVCSALRRIQGHYERINQPFIASRYNTHLKSIDKFDFLARKYDIVHRSYCSWRYLSPSAFKL